MSTVSIHVASNLRDLTMAFDGIAKGHRTRIIAMTLNDAARYALPKARREIQEAGGFKYGYVVSKTKHVRRANAATLDASFEADQKRYSTLSQFAPSPSPAVGRPFRSARPWRGEQRANKAFYIRGRISGAIIPVVRSGKGKKARLHTLYGPSTARELDRPEANLPVMMTVRDKLQERAAHNVSAYFNFVKKRYGL